MTETTSDSQVEAKMIKDVLCVVAVSSDCLNELLEKYSLTNMVRIGAWIMHFTNNSQVNKNERATGPLTNEEIQEHHLFWP